MLHRRAVIIAVILMLFLSAADASIVRKGTPRSIMLRNKGTLLLKIPDSWREEQGNPVKGFPTVVFSAGAGRPFSVQITPMWHSDNDKPLPQDTLKRHVQAMFDVIKGQSLEKSPDIRKIKGRSAAGWCFTATDPAPKPGEYRYLTGGEIQTGSVVMVFTILTNDGQKGIIAHALSILKNATFIPLNQEGSYRIPIPATGSVIEFSSEGMKMVESDLSRPYYFFRNERTGLNVSFNFEPAKKCSSSRRCRDSFAKRQKALFPAKTDWRMSQVGEVFVAENRDGPYEGVDLRLHHMNAHYVQGNVWIDIHLSKADYHDSDRKLFTDFIQSVRIRPER